MNAIFEFLQSRFPTAVQHAVVEVTDDHNPAAPLALYMTGAAILDGGRNRRMPKRHLVRIYAPPGRRYPTPPQQNPVCYGGWECPKVVFASAAEELLVNLAHELAHIDQMQAAIESGQDLDALRTDEDKRYEFEAEVLAVHALKEWRTVIRRHDLYIDPNATPIYLA